jgi:DNA/RNA endonuclease YhcR with UshA esterase domain
MRVIVCLCRRLCRDEFDYVPKSLFGKTICVSGTITEHKGKAEIKVSDPSQIRVVED